MGVGVGFNRYTSASSLHFGSGQAAQAFAKYAAKRGSQKRGWERTMNWFLYCSVILAELLAEFEEAPDADDHDHGAGGQYQVADPAHLGEIVEAEEAQPGQ